MLNIATGTLLMTELGKLMAMLGSSLMLPTLDACREVFVLPDSFGSWGTQQTERGYQSLHVHSEGPKHVVQAIYK